ncbi:hypothetical protein L3i20_v229330 [Paenibacillus sp. L3-i20]|nr:hypothetical protein L3i20_v229330 [Paenibacillus sp. L3-i20]
MPQHLEETRDHIGQEEGNEQYHSFTQEEEEYDPIFAVENEYSCAKCRHERCKVNEVAMTGTGLSKLLDIQHRHYLFVSCLNCGSVDIYDPSVLQANKRGMFGTALDLFL